MAKLKPPEGKFVASIKVGPKGQIVVPKEVRGYVRNRTR